MHEIAGLSFYIRLIGPDDYFVPTLPLFDMNTMNMVECVIVTINNDTLFEGAEDFTIEVMAGASLTVDPARATTTITIIDEDGKTTINFGSCFGLRCTPVSEYLPKGF